MLIFILFGLVVLSFLGFVGYRALQGRKGPNKEVKNTQWKKTGEGPMFPPYNPPLERYVIHTRWVDDVQQIHHSFYNVDGKLDKEFFYETSAPMIDIGDASGSGKDPSTEEKKAKAEGKFAPVL